MKLNQSLLTQKDSLTAKGYQLPTYDLAAVTKATTANPTWVHFGAGNLFRAFLAVVAQNHLNSGEMTTGIIAVEGYDYEIIEKIYHPTDNLGLVAILGADGTVRKKLVASVVESLKGDSTDPQSWNRLKEIFAAPSLQMASFTITEKGYNLAGGDGTPYPDVAADFTAGPAAPTSYIGKVAALLYHRYQSGALPIAMVSMDNCSKNGEKLEQAIQGFVAGWTKNGVVDPGFAAYVSDRDKVSFPWSMIDKITPRPDSTVQATFEADGFEAIAPIITTKNTYMAPFVNAEGPQYLVIEDWFPAGKPLPVGDGIYYTDRTTVSKVETMKVTTCLNPLHTALAIMGCLLGFDLIAKEMTDPDLAKMVDRLGYQEGLPVVVSPGILDPKAFIDEVIQVRLPNPFMPDTPQRIATDTSQKLAIRFGETVKQYLKTGRDLDGLKVIPLIQAAWLRYLLGVDDNGTAFELSPDPMAAQLTQQLKGITLGQPGDHHAQLQPILSNPAIYGVNLYEAGLGEQVEALFEELIAGPGAVRKTLQKVLGE